MFVVLKIFIFLVCFYALINFVRAMRSSKLPPGPTGFPIIGNILQLGSKPHLSITKLSKKYGSLMCLKLGRRTTIVVSSPEILKIVLQMHDTSFCSRTVPCAAKYIKHDKLSVAWLPVEGQWRKLRRIMREQMFSVSRLDASQDLRTQKLQKLLDHLTLCCETEQTVDIGDAAFTTTLNLMSVSLFSEEFAHFDSDSSHEMKELVVLIHNESELSRDDIRHLLLDLFIAGSGTSSSTVEWAMTEVLRNPDKMSRLQDEIKVVVQEKGKLEETDIASLPYLRAVVKETLRLHPASPFLMPRKCECDMEINGYSIPKNAQIMTNVWAIGRDPDIWTEADLFEPEIFLAGKYGQTDFRGKHFELLTALGRQNGASNVRNIYRIFWVETRTGDESTKFRHGS